MLPITVWGHWAGPNPWKVCMILKELDLTYDYRIVEFVDAKKEPYTSINGIGKLPSILDPNTGMKLSETGAIILYLIGQYDSQGKISYTDLPQKFDCIKWLMYQVSGQGPYFGQLTFFARFHPEKIPAVIDRYTEQVEMVFGVLDKALENREWLVGEKCTYADLSFVTWSHVAKGMLRELGKEVIFKSFPRYTAWFEAMESRQPVRDCLKEIAAGRISHGLPA
ncbi:hypothetical protein BP5796_10049 [Coleophoma crateriformis]|uniref:Glutathione S-transferase n=1 Tax=Coleophoma crateriformis TaxID=565419 RepID=A0A3D8QUA8_9HELO|nr:hypothetical protein BP5796_10049 [Coleophoma crateriformis]